MVAIGLLLIFVARGVPLDESWRVIAAVVFVLLAPGASLVPLVGLRDTGVELALVVPLSIATVILTAVTLFYTNTWTPAREFATLVGICAISVAGRVIADIVRRPQTGPEGSPPARGGRLANGDTGERGSSTTGGN